MLLLYYNYLIINIIKNNIPRERELWIEWIIPLPKLNLHFCLVRGLFDWIYRLGRSPRQSAESIGGSTFRFQALKSPLSCASPYSNRRPSFAHPLTDWLPWSLGGLLFYIVFWHECSFLPSAFPSTRGTGQSEADEGRS